MFEDVGDAPVDDVGGDGHVFGQHLEVLHVLQELVDVAEEAERRPRDVSLTHVEGVLYRRVTGAQHRELETK